MPVVVGPAPTVDSWKVRVMSASSRADQMASYRPSLHGTSSGAWGWQRPRIDDVHGGVLGVHLPQPLGGVRAHSLVVHRPGMQRLVGPVHLGQAGMAGHARIHALADAHEQSSVVVDE